MKKKFEKKICFFNFFTKNKKNENFYSDLGPKMGKIHNFSNFRFLSLLAKKILHMKVIYHFFRSNHISYIAMTIMNNAAVAEC